MGQSMFLNYTSHLTLDTNLYHLVLIGEHGSGNIQFMLKTNFENPSLTLLTFPTRVYPEQFNPNYFYIKQHTLDTAQLTYTTDNWTSTDTL